MILDHVLLPRDFAFAFITSFVNTTFTAGNHVKLDTSIWKMGPKSGLPEG
jgi:hypothetical protein